MTFDVAFPKLGLEFTLNRVAFTVGGMNIYWYGVIIATGFALALVFAFSNCKRFGINSDRMIDVIILSTIMSVICGRLYYIIFSPYDYNSLWEIINMRDGGMAIYGAVLGAFGFGYLFCKWRKIKPTAMFDLTAIGFLLGQGIGRWGNFVNQEAFGCNTSLPWGMISNRTTAYLASVQQTLAQQNMAVDPSLPVHPTFLYESIWCLIGFAVLYAYSYHRKFDGEITLMYAAWYGAERALVEGLRTDSLMIGNIRVSQILAALMVVVSIALWIYLRKKAAKKIANGEKTLWADICDESCLEEKMKAKIIDGKYWAQNTKEEVAKEVALLKEQGVTCKLVVFIVGENPASKVYVAGKAKDCGECGIDSEVVRLAEDTSESELLEKIKQCNEDSGVSGILVQLPLPKHINEKNVIDAIAPEKDVDGFTPINVGKMVIGDDCFLPCTPAGCIKLIETTGIDISGKNAVVIGRSNIVGKPAAILLTAKNATVTVCHSKTENIAEICKKADILVAAVGKQGFVTGDMIKKGAVVIDVGINRGEDGKLHGDVDFEAAQDIAGYITPVPGGVGLMTRAMLMVNTLKAAKQQANIK